jgi:hypothetical protein
VNFAQELLDAPRSILARVVVEPDDGDASQLEARDDFARQAR